MARGIPPCQTERMSVIENSKLTVVGAGAVGSSVAYAKAIRGIFFRKLGPDAAHFDEPRLERCTFVRAGELATPHGF